MNNIKAEFQKKTVKKFKCSSCGGELTVMAKRTNFVGCNYCGAVLETTSDAYRVINQLQPPNQFPPKSFLTLGMIGKFDEKYHMIIGRTRWQSNYQEYWAEDGESGFENETWEYDEWVLISEDAQYFYLIEDEEGYHISKSYTPKYPNLPAGANILDFDSNKRRTLNEFGGSSVLFFEGESTYQIKPGDNVLFGMYENGSDPYIVESRLTPNGELKEIEFFREYEKSYAELVRTFAEDDSVKSRQEQMKGRVQELEDIKQRKKTNAKIFKFIFFILAIVYVVSLFMGGQNFFTQTFPCEADCGNFVLKSKKIGGDSTGVQTSANPDSIRVNYIYETKQAITVDPKDHIMDVTLVANINGETDFFANLEILNEQNEVVQEIPCEFHRYIEEGSEDDYVDSKEDKAESFQIDKSAPYNLRLTMELPQSRVNDIQVSLSLHKGSLMNRYFLILMIVSFILWIITFIIYKKSG